jgi:hypothetical protein
LKLPKSHARKKAHQPHKRTKKEEKEKEKEKKVKKKKENDGCSEKELPIAEVFIFFPKSHGVSQWYSKNTAPTNNNGAGPNRCVNSTNQDDEPDQNQIDNDPKKDDDGGEDKNDSKKN